MNKDDFNKKFFDLIEIHRDVREPFLTHTNHYGMIISSLAKTELDTMEKLHFYFEKLEEAMEVIKEINLDMMNFADFQKDMFILLKELINEQEE